MKIKIFDHEDNREISGTYCVKNDDKKFQLVKPNANKSIHITTDNEFDVDTNIRFNILVDKTTPLKLVYEGNILGVVGEYIGKSDSFGNKLHVGDIVTNIVLIEKFKPIQNFSKAICINEDEFVYISKGLDWKNFNKNGVISILEPYTSLLEKGRGYKIMEGLEVR